MVDGDDEGFAGIGGGELGPEPVDLVLVNFRLGFADIGEQADDGGERGGECPEDVGQVHLGAVGVGFQRAELGGVGGHEVLHPAVQRFFMGVHRAVLRPG